MHIYTLSVGWSGMDSHARMAAQHAWHASWRHSTRCSRTQPCTQVAAAQPPKFDEPTAEPNVEEAPQEVRCMLDAILPPQSLAKARVERLQLAGPQMATHADTAQLCYTVAAHKAVHTRNTGLTLYALHNQGHRRSANVADHAWQARRAAHGSHQTHNRDRRTGNGL